jgi:hypothetical protein
VRAITASLVLVVGALLGVIASSGVSRAQAFQSFELGEHDKLIAEASGCWSECRRVGPRRVCTLKDASCKPVCQVVPECKPDGLNMIKVCAVMRGSR